MRIAIITLFPEMFSALQYGIVGRAQKKNILELSFFNPRRFTQSPHAVDDRPYGGGPGMVMRAEPIQAALHTARQTHRGPVIHLSPQGQVLTQSLVRDLSGFPNMILLCSRYEGLDQRVIDTQVDCEYSVGDYVVSGGEIPAMLVIDAVSRILPHALGDPESAHQDSFGLNGLLDHSHYTRPRCVYGKSVPPVLCGGNHQDIERWRFQNALKKTWQKRPDLLQRRGVTQKEWLLLHTLLDGDYASIDTRD